MEIQQSPFYASYIKSLGWQVEKVDGSNLFIKRFPLYGGFAKLQRCPKLPKVDQLLPILKKYRVKQFAIEPDASVQQKVFDQWIYDTSDALRPIRLIHSPYLPTKTIRVDLTVSEEAIFQCFSEAKRRAVRRAIKNHITIQPSSHIEDLITIKNKSSGFLGFITTTGIDKLWPIFAPDHAAILLAHKSSTQLIGGVLLLFWDEVAYYWIAGATREGKKLFAPTLLVWEALKLSKKHGMKTFDFVGVWDERLHRQNKEWLGFTKFKEGFGGKSLYYPIYTLPQKRTL